MEQKDQVAATARSSRANALVSRTLYLVSKAHPALTAAPAEQTSELAAAAFGWDAPISVWWDHPPYQDQ
ncbi:MAG TPA: hypothetical protein VI653_06305 [Steroidobacteraceae bacterium]